MEFELTEQPSGWRVTRASYLPTQWNDYAPGDPIRIQRAADAHLVSVRAAVNGLGGNAGLVELRR